MKGKILKKQRDGALIQKLFLFTIFVFLWFAIPNVFLPNNLSVSGKLEAVVSNLNLSGLNLAIQSAQYKYDNSTEGNDYGEYEPGARGRLQIAITTANQINLNPGAFISTTQEQVNIMTGILNKAISDFESKKVLTHKKIDDDVIKDNPDSPTKGGIKSLYTKGGGLVPECPDDTGCGINELLKLINNVINFLLFVIATPLAALAVAYAGFLLLSSGGSSEKVSQAKSIIKNVVFGYIIALAAWLIINTIFSTLGVSNSFIDIFFKK